MPGRTFKIKVTDVDGGEISRTVDKGTTLGDLLKSHEIGYIKGQQEANDTTLRSGDHVEIMAKSGKAA